MCETLPCHPVVRRAPGLRATTNRTFSIDPSAAPFWIRTEQIIGNSLGSLPFFIFFFLLFLLVSLVYHAIISFCLNGSGRKNRVVTHKMSLRKAGERATPNNSPVFFIPYIHPHPFGRSSPPHQRSNPAAV